ncbi:MAG: peptidoglycan-binding protein [Acidobacteriota bacterium]|nr:peptidoglycan-binding protein [Acidobacteriota bacterium]
MTGWRRVVQRTLPAALAATCMLVPGVWATGAHHPKAAKHHAPKHYVATHQLHQVPSRRAHSSTPARKLDRTVPNRRAKKSSARRYHKTAYHSRYHRRTYRRRFRMPAGPSSDRIEQIQQALSRSGYYQGDPTGHWDADTVSAMRSFQQAHGIPPSGKIDAPSLQQLGLGSDIAGLAPPRPVIAPIPSDSGKTSKGSGSR